MAKKRRNRTWWLPLYQESYNKLFKSKGKVITGAEPLILFDDQKYAYAFALANRMVTKRDESGEVIVNEQGYAQLDNQGIIYVVSIKGTAINWKHAEAMDLPDDIQVDAIHYDKGIELNQKTMLSVIKETKEAYQKHMNNPLYRAGGVTIDNDNIASEELLSSTES